jgi:hypothetical protein
MLIPIGSTHNQYMQTVLAGSLPEFPLLSTRVLPRPALTFPKRPERSSIHEAQSD